MKIKKVLYLTHPELDYGEAFLFYGLCKILGDDNVVTYPFKKTYYGLVANDYILDDGKQGWTEPTPWMIPKPGNYWTIEDIRKRIDEFDIIVLSSGRTYATRAADELIREFGSMPRPLVFTEHEDGDNIRWDIVQKYRPDVIFKREIVGIHNTLAENTPRVYPLTFSCPYDAFPKLDDTKKDIDLFMLCGNTHALRVETVRKILGMELHREYRIHVGIDTGILPHTAVQPHSYVIPPLLPWNEYVKLIARSKIGIAVRGWGRDTIRRWEIPAYNTMMLECDCGLVTPNPFVDGITCVRFREDLSDLEEKIRYYLEHDEERKEIARLGHEHLLNYHTCEKRATYFLDTVEKELGWNED